MASRKEREWTRDELALAIWRFRERDKTYGALPATLRELAHLFDTPQDAVRKLFHRINYLERLAPAPEGYVNGPRHYDLREVWEHFRGQPDGLAAAARAIYARLLRERGPLPARQPIEFGKYRPRK
jgi:hypothetical protein